MIIRRNKQFSLWNKFLTWADKYNASKGFPTNYSETKKPKPAPTYVIEKLPTIGKPLNGSNKIRSASFKELYDLDPWPALCTFGILAPKSEEDVNEMEQLLLDKKVISKGKIETVYVINDNIKGSRGANVNCIVFSPGTNIDSGRRLAHRDNLMWPEDFFCTYNPYYEWYKSGKDLSEE